MSRGDEAGRSLPEDDPTPGRTLKWLFVALVAVAGFIGLAWLAVRLF
ncbi:MAG: hypothetical protein WEE66_06320 [Actinomycetota bacterium]